MKIRNSFVSNSSSSSFVLDLGKIDREQLVNIKNRLELSNRPEDEIYEYRLTFIPEEKKVWGDCWEIDLGANHISGWTSIDNGDLKTYFKKLGISRDAVEIENDWGEKLSWDEWEGYGEEDED